MIYVIVFGPLQCYFSGLSEKGVSFVFEKNHALQWSSKDEALNMESRLNSMFNQQTLEFSVMEKDPVQKSDDIKGRCTECGAKPGQQCLSQCGIRAGCFQCGAPVGSKHDSTCGRAGVVEPSEIY